MRILFDSAVAAVANPARSLLPLASAIWSLRTLTLTAQILLDPKLGFLGTVLEQHSHKHMARALPARAALPACGLAVRRSDAQGWLAQCSCKCYKCCPSYL